jgi:hypothetical protein
MINLRYHIVSLVAVFLALALGIVMGSSVLEGGTISVLRKTSDEIKQSNQAYRAENEQLRAQVSQFQRFGEAALPVLAGGRLKGRSVILLDTNRVDRGVRDAAARAVQAAGAEVEGRITFSTDRLVLDTQGDRTALGGLLDSSQTDPSALRATLVDHLVARLTSPSKLPQDDQGRLGDVLTGLNRAKFLAGFDLPDAFAKGATPFPRAGSIFVLVGPTDGSTSLIPEEFLVPLVDRLSERSEAPVAAVEAAVGPASWLDAVRADRQVAGRVPTVDDADRVPGQVALVWALQQRLAGGPVGHYGIKRVRDLLPPSPAQQAGT